MKFLMFYHADPVGEIRLLNEETSKHINGVLRMKVGDQVGITDGKGNLYTTGIVEDHKKKCRVKVIASTFRDPVRPVNTIGISLLKNTARFEWFLEKASELGISRLVPLICERTEKQSFRMERMQQICISAMLQSQQVYLSQLQEPVAFTKFISQKNTTQKFIAHCAPDTEKKPLLPILNHVLPAIILIGPEGDFTNNEIAAASGQQFLPVSMGPNRLRTETAGMVAAVWLCKNSS